jgi:hypothetical protein
MYQPRFRIRGEPEPSRSPAAVPGGFMCCPLVLQQGLSAGSGGWLQLYRWAYETAQAAQRLALPERFLTPSLN